MLNLFAWLEAVVAADSAVAAVCSISIITIAGAARCQCLVY